MLNSILSIILVFGLTGQSLRIDGSSDWWSLLNENTPETTIKAGSKALANKHFTILGIAVGTQFKEIAAKLGRAQSVQRGDASSGREQVCYASDDSTETVHVIFEFGELAPVFYLFTGGKDWKGSDLCHKSKQISRTVSTSSGLRLGLTRSQIETILGKPDFATSDKLIWNRQVEKKTTPEDFARMRKEYPEPLSDTTAHEKFDSYTQADYIEIRLVDSRLNYLAVSRLGTVD
jgi:hypothetical protein